MFEIGSYVIYKAEGVCRVTDIRSESFGAIGREETYYILTSMNDCRSTVYVPLSNEKLVGYMRKLLSAEQIAQMIEGIRKERVVWQNDSRARNLTFKEILSEGDREKLCALVLTIAEKLEELALAGKKAGTTDTSALRKAEKLLYDEFSATTSIGSPNEILSVLRGDITLEERK